MLIQTAHGAYLQNRFPEIVETVNAKLDNQPVPAPEPTKEGLDPMREEKPMYKFRNGKTIEAIYADTKNRVKVGYLNKYEVCDCYGLVDGKPMVRYKIDGKNNGYKVGFANDTRCVTND